jgi:hypothetical protein
MQTHIIPGRQLGSKSYRGHSEMSIKAIGKRGLPALAMAWMAGTAAAQDLASHYERGDVISPEAFVTDRNGATHTLQSLLAASGSPVNVLYIFGGGDLGNDSPGHLWCQDSFEDLHILRTLVTKYAGSDVNFIAVAAAPAYHSQMLGAPAGVFLNQADESPTFIDSQTAFIESTLAAFDSGIVPIEPYFDTRYRLKLNRTPAMAPGDAFGPVEAWMGAFRGADDTQFYGVPSLWILSGSGEVLAEPFEGNIYHPHGADVQISYTYADVDAKLRTLLAR